MNIHFAKFIAIFLFIVFIKPVQAQTFVGFQTSRGYTLAHHEDLKAIQGIPNIYKLDYAFILDSKPYHLAINKPLAGFSLTYMNHDNKETGHSASLSGFMQPKIYNNQKHTLSGRLSVGLSYVQNPFDSIKNPLQQAIGSKINFFAEGQLIYTYDLSERWNLNLLTGITHISNAARKLPNSGLNIVHLGLGTSYQVAPISKPVLEYFNRSPMEENTGSWSHFVYTRFGFKSIRALDYQVYPAVGLNYTAAYRYGTLGSYTLGLDVDHNNGYIRERKFINENLEEPRPYQNLRWALAAGHEFHMNRFSLLTQLAFYLKRPHATHSLTYQRYGLKYQMGGQMVIATTLRAHGGRADYMEWTLGRKF